MTRYLILVASLLSAISSSALAQPLLQNNNARWPTPSLQVFGKPSPDLICVYVLGEVGRPGVYFLPKGSQLGQAVAAANGTTKLVWWRPTDSGIFRPSTDGSLPKVIPFTKNRAKDEKFALMDGDQIYFGHESY